MSKVPHPGIERGFLSCVTEDFLVWCEKKNESASLENLLIYCIQHKYIPQVEVKRAFVVNKVEEVSFCRKISKTNAVIVIEDEFGIPERTQYQILKEHRKRYK